MNLVNYLKSGILISILLASQIALAQANRPIIAVGEITTAIGQFDTTSIQLALENALQKTNKFTIMERTRLATLLEERGLSASGIADGIDNYSGFSGVDYMVLGSVSNITVENRSVLIASNCEASLSMNIRVVDLATGEIRLSESVEVEDTINSILDGEANACAGISLSSINLIGEEVADGIANRLTMGIFPIMVARVDGSEVYLNYGEGSLSPGQLLSITKLGEGFMDPATGEMLGQEEETTAIILVNEVRSNFTIADIVINSSDPAVGDIAYYLNSRDDIRAVERCVDATQRAVSSCERDPDGRRCESRSQTREERCSVLLDL